MISHRHHYLHTVGLLLCVFSMFVFGACRSSSAIMESAVDALIAEATVLEDAGSFEEALLLYEQALQKYDRSNRLLYNSAMLYAQVDNLAQSLSMLERLNELTEYTNTKYLQAYAGVAAANSAWDVAIDTWHTVLVLDPMEAPVRNKLVDALIEKAEYERAYQVSMEAYELQLFSKELFEDLAFLAEETNREGSASYAAIAATFE